jgi:hypothetical protein
MSHNKGLVDNKTICRRITCDQQKFKMIHMKRFLLTAAIFLGSFTITRAQEGISEEDNAKKMEKIQALYVAYITKELNLTADDAQKFWPVHAEFEKDLKSVKQDLPELERQQKVLDVKKRYQERFTRVLGNSNRTEIFFRKDGEFRRKLIERLRQMRQKRQNMPPRQRRGG